MYTIDGATEQQTEGLHTSSSHLKRNDSLRSIGTTNLVRNPIHCSMPSFQSHNIGLVQITDRPSPGSWRSISIPPSGPKSFHLQTTKLYIRLIISTASPTTNVYHTKPFLPNSSYPNSNVRVTFSPTYLRCCNSCFFLVVRLTANHHLSFILHSHPRPCLDHSLCVSFVQLSIGTVWIDSSPLSFFFSPWVLSYHLVKQVSTRMLPKCVIMSPTKRHVEIRAVLPSTGPCSVGLVVSVFKTI